MLHEILNGLDSRDVLEGDFVVYLEGQFDLHVVYLGLVHFARGNSWLTLKLIDNNFVPI